LATSAAVLPLRCQTAASHLCNARKRLWQKRIALVNCFAQEFLQAHFARSRICGQASFM
jgi:hypothetical protein